MLNGRCVVVTGASGNLGAAVVARLEREGARVFAVDRAVADVTDEAQVEKAYDAAVSKNGPLWGAVHCTGGWAGGAVGETSVATFEKMIALNLRSTFLCCRAAVRRMASGGRIVNVAAYGPLTFTGIAHNAAYAASKAGVIALTKAIAEEGGPVRASCVAPATMRTPQNAAAMPRADQSKWIPLEDVAEAIAYLLSSQAGNGAVITF
ncbi:MAG: SDR family NAD(P)-dependent oxidoreductase [Myxococcales bacterium]|nr:SDR family NAD(P)-dependent oxidoreductase [Myxococcales bacterium]